MTKKKSLQEVEEYISAEKKEDVQLTKYVVTSVAPTYIIARGPNGDNTWMPIDQYPDVKVNDILYL